jgi:hypothetical protein
LALKLSLLATDICNGEVDVVDCGSGTDTVKKGAEWIDRYVGCERFVR